jgi:hypothetical protein
VLRDVSIPEEVVHSIGASLERELAASQRRMDAA